MISLIFVKLVSVGIDETLLLIKRILSDFIELSCNLALNSFDGLFRGDNILNF